MGLRIQSMNGKNLSLRALFASAEERDRVVKEYDIAEGGK
jgi:hypothetical protein